MAAIAIALLFVHFEEEPFPPDFVDVKAEHVARELGSAEAFSKAIAIAPHASGDQMDGFTLLEVKPDSVADRIGLKSGDVIMGVGGIEMDAPEAPFMAYDQLKGLKQVDVKMMRNGQVHWFVVRIVE